MASSVLFPAGLLIYGWTAEYKTHWIGPNIGAALFAAGAMGTFLVCQSYLVDVLPFVRCFCAGSSGAGSKFGWVWVSLVRANHVLCTRTGMGKHDPCAGVGSDRHPSALCALSIWTVATSQEPVRSGRCERGSNDIDIQ